MERGRMSTSIKSCFQFFTHHLLPVGHIAQLVVHQAGIPKAVVSNVTDTQHFSLPLFIHPSIPLWAYFSISRAYGPGPGTYYRWLGMEATLSLLWEIKSLFMQEMFTASAIQHGCHANPPTTTCSVLSDV